MPAPRLLLSVPLLALLSCASGADGPGADTGGATPAANGAPGAPSVIITPTSPFAVDDLYATVLSEAVDPDGDAVTYRYAWTVDGVAWEGTEPTVPASALARGQVWSVAVYPSDGVAEGPPGQAQVTVGNATPVGELVLGPDPLGPDDTAMAAYTFVDADADPVDVLVVWTVDGERAGDGGDFLDPVWFDVGQVVAVSVTLDDGAGGATTLEAETTVAGSPPSTPEVTIRPAEPTDDDDLVCRGVAHDVDGDVVFFTFAWDVDGSPWTGEVGQDLFAGDTIPAAQTAAGETWTCTVVANDGTASSAPAAASVTVGARGPAGPVGEATPADG